MIPEVVRLADYTKKRSYLGLMRGQQKQDQCKILDGLAD